MSFCTSTSDSSKAFTIWCLTGCLLTAVTWLILIIGQLGAPHVENLWVESTYAKKEALTRDSGAPKTLIIGGSGAMFGLDSQLLSQHLSSNVINLGVNAGLQAPWIAHYAGRNLQPGDSVIFALEYPLYYYDDKLNHVALSYTLSHPELLKSLSPAALLNIYWSASLKRIIEGYQGIPGDFNLVLGTYGPHNIGPRGDQVNSSNTQRAIWMQEGLQAHPGEQYGRRFNGRVPNITFWQTLRDQVQQAGGCSTFIPPAMMYNSRYDQPVEKEFYDRLTERLAGTGIQLMGQPRDFFYSMDNFFDTNFHLTSEARQQHTQAVLPLLDSFKQCLQRVSH